MRRLALAVFLVAPLLAQAQNGAASFPGTGGSTGATGPTGPTGATGPAPSGIGILSNVTSGVPTAQSTKLTGGVFFPTADSTAAVQIGNAAGTPFVTFDSTNGRVGIGTTSPSQLLHLVSSGNSTIQLESTSNGSSGVIFKNTAKTLALQTTSAGDMILADQTSGPGRFIVRSNGNVGIGDYYTPSNYPQNKLSVNGSVSIGYTTAGDVAAPANGLLVNGQAKFNNTIQTATILTVATLSTCNAGAEGTMSAVSDALAPTFLSTVVGGGAVHTAVYCDGTNWKAN